MENSSNHKDNVNRAKKSSNGKITVSRETSASRTGKSSSGSKKSGTGRPASDSGAKRSSTGRTAAVSSGAKKSSTERMTSGADVKRSSSGHTASSGNRAKRSSTERSAAASNKGKITVSRELPAESRAKNGNRSAGQSTNKPSEAGKTKQKQQKTKKVILAAEIIGIIIFVVIGAVYFTNKKGKNQTIDTLTNTDVQITGVKVDGIDVSQMTRDQAKQALMNKHMWSLKVTFKGQQYEADNYIEREIDAVLNDAFSSRSGAEYTISLSDPDKIAAGIAKTVSDMWSQPPMDATITGYNAETGEFILSDSQQGYVIDVEKLSENISNELANGNYTASIEAVGNVSEPAFAKEDYKILGTFKTTTTKNENRNTNIRIACETICGTILQPQEQFSYNTVLGRRTAEKGYKEAGAYANGEHVMEIGGGICQVSSTIYNAAIFSGLQIDQRTGHTYEPSYVTPGEDAAVSYSNPDFVFTNNSGATLGIKTTFQDRTIVATVFGVSILPEGVTQYMRSERISDVPPPADIYVEDPAVFPGQSQVVVWPKNGSKWKTYLIQEKDGQIISETDYHTTTYRGTAAEIHVNNSGVYNPAVVVPPAPQPTGDPVPAPTDTPPADTPPADTPPAEPTEG